MFTFFTLLVAFAALGLAAWLRERVVRLEAEVAALRARGARRRKNFFEGEYRGRAGRGDAPRDGCLRAADRIPCTAGGPRPSARYTF